MQAKHAVRQSRQAYVAIGTAFSQIGNDRQTSFLNWGYRSCGGFFGDVDESAYHHEQSDFERLVAELIGPVRLERKRVADIGCGRGGAINFIFQHFRPLLVTGVDISPDNIESARTLLAGKRARLQVADACNLPIASSSQDIILNLESSAAYPGMTEFLHHVNRVLVKSGWFLHGDLWPTQLLQPFQQTMEAIGFNCESFRDVTPQVCRARDKMPRSLVNRLIGDGEPGHLLDYLAAPGSAMFDRLDDRSISYILTRWRKTDTSAALAIPETINQRSDMIESMLTITREKNAREEKWFPFGRPRYTTQVNIIAFPHAVAGASAFKAWRSVFPEEWRFVPMQLPGRENRISEPPFSSIAEAADQILPLIEPYCSRPMVFVGSCLGAKLAFELSGRLQSRGQAKPILLVTCVCPGPHEEMPDIKPFFASKSVETGLRLLGGTPEMILSSPEMLSTVKKAMEGDIEMAAGYHSEAVLNTPILSISATGDDLVTYSAVDSWRGCTDLDFAHHRIEGSHFLVSENGEAVAKVVRTAIEEKLAGVVATGAGQS